MIGKLENENPLYPPFSILLSLFIVIYGLVIAPNNNAYIFLVGVYLLFFLNGYYKACIVIIIPFILSVVLFAGITYLITKDFKATYAHIFRLGAVFVAAIPGIGLPSIALTRSLTELRFPRAIVLGIMIVFNFFPLLRKEIKQIKQAMKTRGAGNIFNPRIFYRAFLIPLTIRLVNISDLLAISTVTRGFTFSHKNHTVYKKSSRRANDYLTILFVGLLGYLVFII